MASRSYYTLIASLPNLPPRYDVDRDPITRPRLRERLKMLEPDDAVVIEQTNSFLTWDRQPLDRTDREVIQTYDRLMNSISNPTLQEMIQVRMDHRTIITAVRHRRSGLPPPIGVGQWVDHIRRNYHDPEFKLGDRFDWIGKLDRLLAAGDAMGAQRLLFETNYRSWSRMAERYTFSFEAVMLYLARWEIIDRWSSQNADDGRQRFQSIMTETLGEYAKLFP